MTPIYLNGKPIPEIKHVRYIVKYDILELNKVISLEYPIDYVPIFARTGEMFFYDKVSYTVNSLEHAIGYSEEDNNLYEHLVAIGCSKTQSATPMILDLLKELAGKKM